MAAGPRDVTADVLAGRDVTLRGDTVVTVPPGTTTYDGVFRGRGHAPRARHGDPGPHRDLPGTHSFSGVIDNGTQLNAGRPEYATSLPRVRKVLNQGTWTVDTPLGQTVTLGMDFYQREYGSDINFDYNGPVTLGASIGGGRFHDTLSAPGAGDVVIAGTPGNDVTFAAVQ
ncbi:hypothetical protein [Streptomyces lomondensis]|uniref:Uncharacterized protein n=1 Tax=Streptomyces lomondensis TaxID=68229 RepID=A0ABQ2X9D8_9ACTN|nr:hypothetical protein [Streptomyces lomondensis]GGX05084.1 hypothetical protein GCM10010383_38900 [Streptomyces lomondensis]